MKFSDKRILTYQDFEGTSDREGFVRAVVANHRISRQYRTAVEADRYDAQKNTLINEYAKMLFTATGEKVVDFTATNSKIASNFFSRLNVQRCSYSLGNGITFAEDNESAKEALGRDFDHDVYAAAYKALIHGVCFCFWNSDRLYPFPLTEFAPIWDENDGSLRAGVRFWQIAEDRPMTYVLYEEDGYTKYRDSGDNLEEVEPKRSYIARVQYTEADGESVVGWENYSRLPIVPLWGSRLHQSTLVGMKEAIDSYDLIQSGFANDLSDCAQIYWIVENYGGMDDEDLARFRDKLLLNHVATADTSQGGKITPYAQEIPYQARQACLEGIRSGIYEAFGAFDVKGVSANATATEINASYQPLDENADDFEYQVSECVKQVLRLIGIDDEPTYKRNRISNQLEQVQMVVAEAQWLDQETVLNKLPNITPDEVQAIMDRSEEEAAQRMPVVVNRAAFGQGNEETEE